MGGFKTTLRACRPPWGKAGGSQGGWEDGERGDPVHRFQVVAEANCVAEDRIYSQGSGGQKPQIKESAGPGSVCRLLATPSSSGSTAVSLRSLPVTGCVSVLSRGFLLCVCVRVSSPRLIRAPVTADLRPTITNFVCKSPGLQRAFLGITMQPTTPALQNSGASPQPTAASCSGTYSKRNPCTGTRFPPGSSASAQLWAGARLEAGRRVTAQGPRVISAPSPWSFSSSARHLPWYLAARRPPTSVPVLTAAADVRRAVRHRLKQK